MDILRDMLKEINKKIDVVNQREGVFGKKLDNVDKRLGGLIRQVNKVREIVPNVLSLQCSLNQYTLWQTGVPLVTVPPLSLSWLASFSILSQFLRKFYRHSVHANVWVVLIIVLASDTEWTTEWTSSHSKTAASHLFQMFKF